MAVEAGGAAVHPQRRSWRGGGGGTAPGEPAVALKGRGGSGSVASKQGAG
jgi:hypothetical protein